VRRDGDGWSITWSVRDVNSMWTESIVMTTESLLENGPPALMTADALDALARELGREPSSLSWCVERRLVERIVADDLEGVLVQLAAMGKGELPTFAPTSSRPEPILRIALGVAAWKVAAELIQRGEPLTGEGAYAIAALDDSDGAALVLQRLIERGRLEPSAGLLRHVRSPRVVHALVEAGVHPDAHALPDTSGMSALEPELTEAKPLAIAVVRSWFDVAAALLECGASLEARDKQGRTALLLAVRWGNEAPVRWLLDHGADPKCAPDVHGRTPRSLALARPDDAGSRVLLRILSCE
jgi:hypothetical protein